MARYRNKTRAWIQARIDFLENQTSLGAKSVQTAEGSTTYVTLAEAELILSGLEQALDAHDGVTPEAPKPAVFRAWRVTQRPY